MKIHKARYASVLVFVALLSACANVPDDKEIQAKAEKDAEAKAEVAQAMVPLNAWAEAMASRKTENVLKLYEEDAVLLATFEPKPITSQEERKKYFDGLLKKQNLKVTYNEVFADIEDDMLTTNGMYTFSFTEGSKTIKVPARFTFVFEKDDGAYEIEAHHSSLLPKK